MGLLRGSSEAPSRGPRLPTDGQGHAWESLEGERCVEGAEDPGGRVVAAVGTSRAQREPRSWQSQAQDKQSAPASREQPRVWESRATRPHRAAVWAAESALSCYSVGKHYRKEPFFGGT